MEWSIRAPVAFVLTLFSTAVAPASTGVLTEAEAIRTFLEQSPRVRWAAAVERSAAAALRVEARLANPEVAYQIEDAGGVRDEFLTFQQELPITGRRGLLNERAEVAAAAAGLAARGDLRGAVHGLRSSFHEILYRERVLERLRSASDLLEQTVEILRQREREGEGSGYDVLRAEQELVELRLTTADADAALSAARSRFGAFYDPDRRMEAARLHGDSNPSGPVPDAPAAAAAALEQRLDLQALAAERERLDLERRAARRSRFPQPVVTAGWKRSAALGLSDTGYVAGLMLPLPIFDRGTLEAARAAAEGERLELETELLARRIRADVQVAIAREHAARQAAELYGGEIDRRAVELHSIARLRYDEGESGILDLLDAHRTSLTMQLRALAARYEAKLAEIERERVSGDEVKP